jgi:molybdopterin molybdotransferase
MEMNNEGLSEVSDAQKRILQNHAPLGVEIVKITHALGRIVACDISAPFDFPSFSNSSMDGFAVRSTDVEKASPSWPVTLQVIADIPAGSTSPPDILSGQAARIMTGAMIPSGVDAVIPVENTDFFQSKTDELPKFTRVYRSVKPGEFIRHSGQDVKKGEIILEKGRKVESAQLGLCAMFGIHDIPVYRKPKVAILASGNELLLSGEKVIPGKVYDANSLMLASLVEKCGGAPYPMGISPDDKQMIKERFDASVKLGVDLIISSAGVSVGAFDYMRQVIEENGRIDFWRVNMRPGKPLVSGNYRGITYLGLPGNPVSAFVGFLVFIEPLIKKMAGYPNLFRREYTVKLANKIQSDGRQSYLRGLVTEDGGALTGKMVEHQSSGDMVTLSRANTLLIIPSGVKSVRSGEKVKAWSIVEDIW